ncbi:MAG: FtsP/CotA-like multicopper oxidase with cupredoxin domain [Spirosomataceae bacterium]
MNNKDISPTGFGSAEKVFVMGYGGGLLGPTIRYAPRMQDMMDGYLGDHIMVSGTMKPYTDVATRFYRLRVLNGSSARVYNLAMSNDADFYVAGSDNGLLPQPEKVNSLMLASGERVDLLVDFPSYAVGEQVFLMSKAFDDMERIDETVNYGATETWEFDNSSGEEPQSMHIHAVQFQVVKRTGGRN